MGRVLVFTLVWMCTAAPNSAFAAQATANPSRDEQAQIKDGGRVVAQVCSACHTTLARMLQAHRQTREQWKSTVHFMIGRGAQVMPEEIEPVIAFLASTAGPRK